MIKKKSYDISSQSMLEPYTCLNKHGMFETYFAEISWELFKRVETINAENFLNLSWSWCL